MGAGWWIVAGLGLLAVAFLFSRSLIRLGKAFLYLLVQTAIGAFMVFLVNAAGQLVAFSLPLNLFTSIVAGFLGLPGVAVMILAKLFIL